MRRRQVSTPKEFFQGERDRFYSDWTLSFWREFFQNSVDAGARNIDISVDTTVPRGAFDEAAADIEAVTRVVFSDDGCGMSKEVLEGVYFSIGSSTKKDGGTVGGYGRARLMTCFSNVRYSILTNDRFVIGDGPDWVSYGLDEAIEEIDRAVVALRTRQSDFGAERAVDGLLADGRLVADALAAGGRKGCRVEVDLDPFQGHWHRRPTAEVMLGKLRQYISESQIVPRITINGKTPEEFYGVEGRIQARRGPIRRALSAQIDDREVEFANVHLSEGAKAAHKGKVIVRVDGASMFVDEVNADVQVIVELHPELSREVMTSNRDGLRDEYRRAFQSLLQEIAVDNRSALKERNPEKLTIRGRKGTLLAKRPSFLDMARQALDESEVRAADAAADRAPVLASVGHLVQHGVPVESFEAFIHGLRFGDSFISARLDDRAFRFRDEFGNLRAKLINSDQTDGDRLFFSELSPAARAWVAEVMRQRFERNLAEIAVAHDPAVLEDMYDTVVHVENADKVIRSAIRRNDPRTWDVERGKGRQPRSLLVAWTAACSVAVEALMRVRPSLEEFQWTTGWCYDTPKDTYQGDRSRHAVARAMCVTEDGRRAFLVNPIAEDGRLAFNPSDPADRQRLQALAMHEVAHAIESWHNEVYAGILTDLMEVYDYREANRRMKDAIKGVHAAYARGRARIQAMDDDEGVRPSDRLMAHAAPRATIAGTLDAAVTREADGTRTVDCDALDEIERRAGYEPGPEDPNDPSPGWR